ncbi:MAG: hypothetical protein JRI23_17885 [Deltaproteobacteria bacterium]|nr:hypothetical protein [Deltaproteobacteria bacterium]MBW2533709.1 hypothetical protein [Deltaproteobacteria bacterium]
MKRHVAVLAAAVVVLGSATAGATEHLEDGQPHPVPSEHAPDDGNHGAEHHFVVGAMGSYFAGIHGDEVHHLGGGGLLFEAALIPHWLELEYSVRALTDGHLLAFPIEILLKLPFHLSDTAVPFVGAGPALIPAFVDEVEVHGGVATAAGVCFWLWSWGGLFVEANYNLVFDDGITHELGGSGGLGYRF